MLAASGPNRKSRWLSRTWPHRGLPVASSASKVRMLASSAGSLRRNGSLLLGSESNGAVSSSTQLKASKSSRREASMEVSAAAGPGARIRRRVKRWMRSASPSLARATATNSASRRSASLFCSRSTSTWRSTSDTVEPLRMCGRRMRASNC